MTIEPRRRPLALSSSLLIATLSSAHCAPNTANARPAPPSAATAEPAPAPSAPATSSTPGTPDVAMRPSEAALRRIIATIQHGEPLAELMEPPLAEAVQAPRFRGDVVNLGEVESVEYKATGREGFDIYEVSSKTGFSAWRIKLGPEGKASGLLLRVMEKPPSKPLTPAEFVSELEKRMLDAATEDEFSGVVLVARGGEPIFQKALGLADREHGIPNQAAPAGAAGSKHAAHITGKTGNARATWAGVGVAAQDSAPYDLSPWARVCFRAKGSGHARFSVADVNTSPAGGVCQQCYNNFGAPFTLSPDWQEHCVAFSEMTQAGRWGAALAAVVPAKVYSMAWSINDRGADYDLWVDDVRLVCH